MFPTLLLFGLFVSGCVSGQVRPPNFSPDHLPDTDFTCEDKVTGGYYADVEAHCQLFHVCVQVSEYEFQDFHFLCPNDTVFDQQHLVCTNWFEVDCHAQLEFFTNDFGVRSVQSSRFQQEDEDVKLNQDPFRTSKFRSKLRNTGRGQVEVGRRNNFQDDLSSGGVRPPISGTPIPLGFTTTIRPAGKPSSASGFLSGRNLKTLSQEETEDEYQEEPQDEFREDTPEPTEAPAPRFFGGAGRKPKVKSNLKAANFHNGQRKKFGGLDNSNQGKERKKFRSFREPEVSHSNRFQEPEPRELNSEPYTEDLDGPEVRPDGREPRVKGDLLAEIQNNFETTTIPSFIETFFASPSSPKPFLFRGAPAPLEEDLFGSASTAQPFFLPTAKSPTFSGISQTPLTSGFSDAFSGTSEPSLAASEQNINDIENEEEETDPTDTPTFPQNRFRSRPAPTTRFDGRRRGQTSRFTTESTKPEEEELMEDNNDEANNGADPVEQKGPSTSNTRHPKKNFNKKVELHENTAISKDGPSRDFTSGRRPRVKSNIRAKTRNYWQQTQPTGAQDSGEGGRNRKLRRGRKQRVEETANLVDSEEDMEKDMEDEMEMEDHEMSAEEEEEEKERNPDNLLQKFFPTPTPEQRLLSETSVSTPTEEADIFEDLFEEDDLIFASSTVSSVVFKGSPSPAPFGFFSSPSPNYDKESGVFVAGPRPSFTNIGNDIDLGPKKFQSPDQFVFVTSTQSNKIFIGSSEEPPAPALSPEEKRTFPSFPIRGKSLSFPFRPKPSLSPTKPSELDTTDAIDENDETKTTEITEIPPVTSQTTAATTAVSEPTRFNPFRGANRNFKSLFGRTQGESTRSRFNPFSSGSTPAEVEEEVTTTAATTTTSTEAATAAELLEELLTTLQPENVPKRRFPSALRQSVVGIKPFRGAARSRPALQEVKEPETTTEIIVPTNPEPVTEKVTESSLLLSVESELSEDEDIQNEISVDQDDEPEELNEAEEPENSGFRRFNGVKKARKPPPNANIRVEFKKAPVSAEEDLTKKFFVKPDGRKPRVKSNIRARLADKGQFPFEETEATGFRHSTRVDAFEFNGDPELENVDNTEKREINHADLNLLNFLNPEEQSWSEIAEKNWMEKNSGEFVTPVHSLAQLEQNSQSVVQSKVDTSPTFPSAPTHQNSPIFKPEPLTLNTRPSNSPSALLEQIVVKPGDPAVPLQPSADNVAFAAGGEVEMAEPVDQPSARAGPATPSLSAFQALLSHKKNEFSLQLLNTRDPNPRGISRSSV